MTWYFASDYTPSGGPVAASATPGSIGHGYVDVTGNIWSIDSSNILRAVTNASNAFNASILLKTSAIDQVVDSKITFRMTSVANQAIGCGSRYSNTAGNSTGYLAICAYGTNVMSFFALIAGSPTLIGSSSTPSAHLVDGTLYDVTVQTTQTNPTTTALSIQVADTSGNLIFPAFTANDTTLALQNLAGGPAMIIPGNTGGASPGKINRVQTFGDVNNAPTSYNVFIPATANQNQAVSGTISPVGGASMTSSLVVTLSDGAGGTFSPNPVTIPTGTPSANFTYTPTTSGSLTVSYSHTGGNVGMTGDGSTAVAVTASTTFYLNKDYIPSGGPIAASPNPGSIGNGYVDVTGNVWSIDAQNVLHAVVNPTDAYNSSLLLRTSAVEQVIDSQIIMRFTCVVNEGAAAISRASSSGGNSTGYLAICASGSNILSFFSVISGTLDFLGSSGSPTSNLIPGQQYDFIFQTTQADSSNTKLVLTVSDLSGNVINTLTHNDAEAPLQNLVGSPGVYIPAQTSGDSPGSINRIQTYGDVNNSPTSYYTYVPTVEIIGQSVIGTVFPINGANMTSPLSVTLSDGAGGTFSPNPVIVASGVPSESFTYTPAITGPLTVSYSHTGGNVGMTGDGSTAVYVYSLVTLGTNSHSCVLSPYNWSVGSGGASTSQTHNAGAYARFYVKGCLSATILTDPAQNGNANFIYSIDNGPVTPQIASPASGQTSIVIPDTGSHVINIYFSDYSIASFFNAGRWNRTFYFGLVGVQLVAQVAGGGDLAITHEKNIIIFGDSITEGYHAVDGTNNANEYCYSFYLAQAFWELGYEYGICATGSLGYTAEGAGGVVPLFTIGSDSQSSWNKVDQSTPRLVNGFFSPVPDVMVDNHGTNDFVQGHFGNALRPFILAFYKAMRAACKNCVLIKVIPFGGYVRADILAALAQYQSPQQDPNQITVDLNIDNRLISGSYTHPLPGDNVHPTIWGHANLAALLIPIVVNSVDLINQSRIIEEFEQIERVNL